MITAVLGQVLALGGMTLAGLLTNRFLRIELTLSCLLVGFLAGLGLEYVDFDTGIRAHNLQEIVFFYILPVLIFEAAWHIKPSILKRWLVPVLLLATFGVLSKPAGLAAAPGGGAAGWSPPGWTPPTPPCWRYWTLGA